MRKQTLKGRLFSICLFVSLGFISAGFSLSAQSKLSLVSDAVRYKTSPSDQWTEWAQCAIPILIGKDKITFGSIPVTVFTVIGRKKLTSGDEKDAEFTCRNPKGTEFTVTLQFSSGANAILNVDSNNGMMSYECTVSNEKPYFNMVDLGLSCKWGLSNYYDYSTSVVDAVFGEGIRMRFDEAYKLFGSGKQHLPSTEQIKELLAKCSWEFIDNPLDDDYKCYLVTGPNGNSIILPCYDGGKGNYSSDWYLGADEFDAFLSQALQLNINSRIVYPFDKRYFGCIRLVQDN